MTTLEVWQILVGGAAIMYLANQIAAGYFALVQARDNARRFKYWDANIRPLIEADIEAQRKRLSEVWNKQFGSDAEQQKGVN